MIKFGFISVIFLFGFAPCRSRDIIKISGHKNPDSALVAIHKADDLLLLCQEWGFLKYHHPAIMKGGIDWDQRLFNILPLYLSAEGREKRDEILTNLIRDLGEVPNYPALVRPAGDSIKSVADYHWISPVNFSPEICHLLENLENNNDGSNQQYIKLLSSEGISLPSFINEKSYSAITYPPVAYRLLAIFRYWNIIEYWYPYKHLFRKKWSDQLKPLIIAALRAENQEAYINVIRAMVAAIEDTHAVIHSYKIENTKGKWQMPFALKFINKNAIIVEVDPDLKNTEEVKTGNLLRSVNHSSISELSEKLRPMVSASNMAAKDRELAKLITRTNDSVTTIETVNSHNEVFRLTVHNKPYNELNDAPPGISSLQRDSSIVLLRPDVLYINIGNRLVQAGVW